MMGSRTTLFALVCAAFALPTNAIAGPTLLFDASNGRVLYAEDVDDHWYPASLTKIMTAYVTFEALKAGAITLESKLTTSELAHAQQPSKIGLPVGGQMSVEMGLQALIVKSANDVAVMLAEAIGGSEQAFVERMNATARRLGMTRTNFVNPHGLPAPEQLTTARDLAILSRAIVRDFPEHRERWASPDMRIGKRRLGSHNSLLKVYDGADGLKTGFICDSGYNVVASATRDGRQLMAVVLGETSGMGRAIRAASLLDHGFENYGWKQLFDSPSLDSMPRAPEPRAAMSVRQAVTSWSCNGRPRVATKSQRKGRAAAKKEAAAKGAPADGAKAKSGAPSQAPAAKAKPKSASTQRTPAATAKPKSATAQAPVTSKAQ